LFPDELSVVFFANSGSEANDLAWRMARTVTKNDGIIVTKHAYHGATALTMATSPEELGIENLEPWVATVPAPDPRRRDDNALVEAIEGLDQRGYRPAALAFDTVFSSDGIFEPSPGYLRDAAAQVRDAGGLFIADEVQAGFGRVGTRMWGFAGHDVVPDIVTLGKPMGNGHPVAALITTPAIAEAFTRDGYYFSTFAGNPVSTAAAMAVLDVMAAEGLPAKAERVGAYLQTGLSRVADEHPSITDVRGPAMFIGVELSAGEHPDPERAEWIVNEMRRRHILIGRTGIHSNVLKIRPPLAFDESHADLLIESLGRVLSRTQE
jgi:4-aminobutyrate aminotransferase-like enzyme